MNVHCIIKDYKGNKSLEFVFECASRAYATRDRLEKKIAEVDKGLVTYKVKEMYVYKGEEPKDVPKHKKD